MHVGHVAHANAIHVFYEGTLKIENKYQRCQVMIARTNINANETPVRRNRDTQ